MKPSPFKRIPLWIVGAVLALVCLLRTCQVDLVERLECMTFDWRARLALQLPAPVATNLGFVYITEESVKRVRDGSLGYSFGLYWPRQVYGRLVQELAAQGAHTVALDVILGGLRRDHPPVQMADGHLVESDYFLAQQLQRVSNTIIAVTREVSPPALFLTNALAPGDISTDRDPDGILRRARAFQLYRRWHPVFLQAEADPDLGIDLSLARLESNQIVLPRPDGEQIRVPLDAQGNFALADFVGDKLPAGLASKAKPFTEERVWHMGIVLAARQLQLDLSQAEVDLPHGRITLRGPAGLARTIPVDARGYFYIDWCLPLNHPQLTQQPIHDLLRQHRLRLEGQTNQCFERWRGKLAVVGSAAVLGNDLTDRGATPLEADTLLVSKHWNVASDLITGRFVQRSGLGVDCALILGLGLLAALLTWQLRPLLAFGVVLGLAGVYIALGVHLYLHTRYWIPLVLPLGGALLLTHICLLTWRVVFEQTEQRRIKAIFSTLVSPKIVQELLQAETLSLGGARRQITVLFADVRDFTEFTDTCQEQVAQQVRQQQLSSSAAEAAFDEQARHTLATVNLYLGLVADTILQHDGTLNKFIGDCVMAFWGAPAPHSRHALACVRAAIEAQRAIFALNRQRASENQRRAAENLSRLAAGQPPLPLLPILRLGTGINSGMATVGLMGSETHAVVRQGDYTAFGREVNLASRLEGASGHGHIFISEATYQHLRRDDPALADSCLALAPIAVKGFRTPVKVFEVPWRPPEALLWAESPGGENPELRNPQPGANPNTELPKGGTQVE